MAWIASNDSLLGHPKLSVLMERMGWDEDQVIGKLHRFWWWCLKYAPTGNLMKFNDAALARSVGLAVSDGKKFVSAMVESCLIDRSEGRFCVHDWRDYAGRYVRDSLFSDRPEMWAEVKALYPRNGDEDDTVGAPAGTRRGTGRKSAVPTHPHIHPPTHQPAGAGSGGGG